MSLEILERQRRVWSEKPILRALYQDWYDRLSFFLRPGPTVELAGGSGHLKDTLPGVITTDLLPVPWVDFAMDATEMALKDESVANLILIDGLHHLENPVYLFREASRVLSVGGRLLIIDPYVSLWSWPVYHFFHPEPVLLSEDPLAEKCPDPNRRPFDSNQAVARLIFKKHRNRFESIFPALKIERVSLFSFFAYPLTGGFSKPSLLPLVFLKPLLWLEKKMSWAGEFLAYRVLVVLEKR